MVFWHIYQKGKIFKESIEEKLRLGDWRKRWKFSEKYDFSKKERKWRKDVVSLFDGREMWNIIMLGHEETSWCIFWFILVKEN